MCHQSGPSGREGLNGGDQEAISKPRLRRGSSEPQPRCKEGLFRLLGVPGGMVRPFFPAGRGESPESLGVARGPVRCIPQ